jgi:hypothetical protein
LALGKGRDDAPQLGGLDGLVSGGVAVAAARLGRLSHRSRAARGGAVVVEGLVSRDRHQPGPQLGAVLESGIGAKGGQKGLLKAVVRIARADRAPEEAKHRLGMRVE